MNKPLRNSLIAVGLATAGYFTLPRTIWPEPERTTIVNLAETYSRTIQHIETAQLDLLDWKPLSMKEQQLEGIIQELQATKEKTSSTSNYERTHPEYQTYQQAQQNHKSALKIGIAAIAITMVGASMYIVVKNEADSRKIRVTRNQ